MAGIYVGEDLVIHFIATKIDGSSEQKPPCGRCGYQKNVHLGVVRTCLDCFGKGHTLRLYQYETSSLVKKLKISGTCTTCTCLSPEDVVKKANEFYEKNKCFGEYDFAEKNCEHFATLCKTGTGFSEQVNDYMSLPILPGVAKKIKNKMKLSS